MQGRGVERPQWASDVEVHWMLALGSTFLTARRLVFENGLYERAVSECEQLHLLDNTGRKRPAPGPTEQEVADAVARRIHELDAPAAPASWVRECGGRIEPLTGSAEAWAKEWGVGMNVEQKPSLPEQRG
jgi:hypothetical protein